MAACGGSDESADEGAGATTTSGGEPVTVDWWHIQNSDPGLSLWKAVADEYMADHPNVTIKITVQENEAFKKALQTNLQAGDVPDIFQSWGGGGLREQVDAGLVKDVTDDVESWDHELNGAAASMMEIEDKMYGVPFDLGIVGVWYNKALFEQGRHRRAARDVGRVARRRREAEGRRHHADLARRRATSGRGCSGTATWPFASQART